MKIIYTLLFLSLTLSGVAQMQLDLAVAMGGIDNDVMSAVAVDQQDNIWCAGEFRETVDLDPGPGTTSFTSVSSTDAFIVKLNSSGQFLWAAHMASTSSGKVFDIALDASGNCYATGIFRGTIDLDPGPGTASFTTVQYDDIFIVSLDPQGNYRWGKHIGTNGGDFAWSVCSDPAGNVTVLGDFMDTMDLDPGIGVANLTSNGQGDMFLLHLDSMGNYIWAVNIGGKNDESPRCVETDAAGNIYATGYFRDTVDFDPGPGTDMHYCAGQEDIFIIKLDQNGNYIWGKSIGGTEGDDGKSVAADANGVYICGYFHDAVDFDPGPGTAILNTGLRGAYLLKLDLSGNFQWVHKFSNSDQLNAYNVDINPQGDVYVSLLFEGVLDLDPSSVNFPVIENGTGNVAYGRYDAAGNFIWGGTVGGSGFDYAGGLAAGNGYFVSGCNFELTADMDPNSSSFDLTSLGDQDMAIVKIIDATASIENREGTAIKVYPNPCRDYIYIETGMEKGLLNIYDSSGRKVLADTDFNARQVDISLLKAGIYTFELLSGDEAYRTKFQKLP